ncbi:MAG TPA: hypothetical protein VKB51_17700 [bacterium]|nr:hypothetical protein [bacterium]
MENPGYAREPESPWVFRAQLATLIGFSCFAALVITWIGRLIYISWVLADVFSASIGIALVAVPIFLGLAIIFNYVFWGLHRGRQQVQLPSADDAP